MNGFTTVQIAPDGRRVPPAPEPEVAGRAEAVNVEAREVNSTPADSPLGVMLAAVGLAAVAGGLFVSAAFVLLGLGAALATGGVCCVLSAWVLIRGAINVVA